MSNPQLPPVPPGTQHKLAVILTLHRLRSRRHRVTSLQATQGTAISLQRDSRNKRVGESSESKSRSSLHVTSHALAEARPSTKTAAAQLPGCRRNCQQQVGVTLVRLPCRSSCLCDNVVISRATGASLRPCRHTGWGMADWLLTKNCPHTLPFTPLVCRRAPSAL